VTRRQAIASARKSLATASVETRRSLSKAELHYTTDAGPWQKRHWETVPATLKGKVIEADLPSQRPLVCYLSATDDRGLRASTEHEELE